MVQKIDGSTQVKGGSIGAAELEDTAITPGTYGSAGYTTELVIDQDGRITSATDRAESTPGLIEGELILAGIIEPAEITSDKNNYSPTGIDTASVIRLTSDSQWNITGLDGGSAGRIFLLLNAGDNNIILLDESNGASSSAANRFDFNGTDFPLYPRYGMILQYNETASRWQTYSFNQNTISTSIEVDKDGSLIDNVTAINFQTGDGTNLSVFSPGPGNPVNVKVGTITEKVALTTQTADITPTLFGSDVNGQYRVCYYLVATTTDAGAGNLTLEIACNDGTAGRTFDSSTVSLTTGGIQSGEFIIRIGNSTQPTYAVSIAGGYGTANYALYLAIQPLGLD